MAEEIVKVIRVDTKGSAKSINQLKKEIKQLKTELEASAVGSAEFSAKLKALGQVQQQYAEINMSIAARTQDMEKSFAQLASFSGNLAKGFSSINAMFGLLGDNSEDVNKSLLKVAQTLQLIQGLPGFGQMLSQLPKVVAIFKNWADSLLPINRRITDIASNLNGLNSGTLKTLEKIAEGNTNININNGGNNPTTTTTAAAGSGYRETVAANEAYTKQTAILGDLTKERDGLSKKLIAEQKELKALEAELQNATEFYEVGSKFAMDFSKSLVATKDSFVKTGDAIRDAQAWTAAATAEMGRYGYTAEEVANNLKVLQMPEFKNVKGDIQEATEKLEELREQSAETAAKLAETENAMSKVGLATTKTGRLVQSSLKMVKSAIYSLGIMALIMGAIAAIQALGKAVKRMFENWMYSANLAAKSQKTINEGLKETSQLAAKPIAILYELAIAYKKVGDTAEEKEKFIKKYADKIKETGIEIADVTKAEDVFVNNTDKYVDALMKRAKAQAIENTAIKLYQAFLDEQDRLEQEMVKKRGVSKKQFVDILVATGSSLEDAEKAWYESSDKKVQDIFRKMELNEAHINDRLKQLFEDVADLESQYEGAFATASVTTDNSDKEAEERLKKLAELKEKELEELAKYYKAARDLFKDARTKELDDVREKYDAQIELAKKYGKDTTLLEQARQREIQDILKKYSDQAIQDQKDAIQKQFDELQNQLERIRKMNATSNLKEPSGQNYQTNYKQPNITSALGLGGGWLNTYQSGQNIQDEYQAQVEYNNKLLELTRSRIEQENAILNQQLEIEGLTADQRLEIQRTLAENEIALSDAVANNEQKNLSAYKKVQEAKQQALNATLSVASSITGSLASLAQMEMNDSKKSEKERGRAANAYAALGISQAIIDTYKSANESYSAMASIPYVGPALGAAAAAAAVIAGIANVKQIMKAAQDAKLSASASVSMSSSASVSAPAALDTMPIEYTRNLLGDKETSELNKPIKCYVLESEITTTQNKVAVTEQNASF